MSLQPRQSGAEARRVRFHPPVTDASGEARIPFDVGGLPAGQLREFANRGGSRWTVSSIDADLSGISIPRVYGVHPEALTLGRACRLVEEAAAAGAGGDESLAGVEGGRRNGQEASAASAVRFRSPGYGGGLGYAEIGVEVDGRLVGHLREVPADPRDGSQWIMYSRHPELDLVGTGEPGGLGKACRDVAAAAERCRDRLSAPPERGPEMER